MIAQKSYRTRFETEGNDLGPNNREAGQLASDETEKGAYSWV